MTIFRSIGEPDTDGTSRHSSALASSQSLARSRRYLDVVGAVESVRLVVLVEIQIAAGDPVLIQLDGGFVLLDSVHPHEPLAPLHGQHRFQWSPVLVIPKEFVGHLIDDATDSENLFVVFE